MSLQCRTFFLFASTKWSSPQPEIGWVNHLLLNAWLVKYSLRQSWSLTAWFGRTRFRSTVNFGIHLTRAAWISSLRDQHPGVPDDPQGLSASHCKKFLTGPRQSIFSKLGKFRGGGGAKSGYPNDSIASHIPKLVHAQLCKDVQATLGPIRQAHMLTKSGAQFSFLFLGGGGTPTYCE